MKQNFTRVALSLIFLLLVSIPARAQFASVTPPTPFGPYCAGASFSIDFTLTLPVGAAGVVAELSDNTGAFPGTNVGSVTLGATAMSGTVPVAIPSSGLAISSLYKIRLKDAATGLITSTPTAAFTINTTPKITNNPLTAGVCSGTATNIVLTASESSSFAWTATNGAGVTGASAGSGGTIAQTLANSSATTDGTATYVVTPTSTASTCVGASSTFTVTVFPAPTVSASPAQPYAICSGTATSITLTPSVAGTISWTAANDANTTGAAAGTGTSIAQTLSNSSPSAASAATYTITATSTANSCVGPTLTYPVAVNPLPVITSPGATSTTICSGAATSIALAASTGSTFSWTVVSPAGLTGASPGSGGTIAQTLINSTTAQLSAVYTITPFSSATPGCAGAAFVFTVAVDPAPAVSVSPAATTVCSGGAINLTLTSSVASTFSWTALPDAGVTGASGGTGTTISQTLSSSSNSATREVKYAITATSTANGCVGPATNYIVTINPKPVLTGPASAQTCSGSPANIALTASTPSTFTFTGTNGPTVAGAGNGSGSTITQTLFNFSPPSGTASYSVIPTSQPGCIGNAATIAVTVNSLPTAIVPLGPITICSGATTNITLSASLSSTFSYTAANGSNTSGFSSGTGSTIAQTLTNTTNTTAGSTIYTVTPTSTAGCPGGSFTITVNVNPAPALATTAPVATCSGNTTSILLTATTAGTNTFNYTATNSTGISGGSGGTSATIAQTLSNSSNAAAGTTTYAVTPTSQQGCAGAVTNLVQTVNPRPVITTATTASVCSGGTTSIALAATTPSTFSWLTVSAAGTSGNSAGTGNTIAQTLTNASNSTAGQVIYSITPVSTAMPACTGTGLNLIVAVNPSPALTSPTTASVCSGQTTSIALTASTAGTSTFAYSATNGANASGGSPGTGAFIAQTLTNSGNSTAAIVTYTVTPVSALSCAGTPTAVTVAVNPKPIVQNAATAAVCSGTPLSIPLTASTPSTFTWTATNGAGTTGASAGSSATLTQTLNNASNVATSNASYTVTPTSVALPGCTGSPYTINITVNPKPTLPLPWTDSICNLGTFTRDNGSTGPATKYTWTVAPVAGISGTASQGVPNDSFTTTLINTTSGPIVVPFAITPISPAPAGCAGNAFTLNLKVNPTGTISSPNPSSVICSGTPTAIVLNSTVSGAKFVWTPTSPVQVTGAFADSATGSSVTIAQVLTNATNSAPFSVQYSVIATTPGGCGNGSGIFTVIVNPLPALLNPNSKDICSGKSTSILLTSSTGAGSTFKWSVIPATSGLISGASAKASYVPVIDSIGQVLTSTNFGATDSIKYSVTTRSAAGCESASPNVITVRVAPSPQVSVTNTSPVICSNTPTNIPLSASASSSFTWTASNGAKISGATPSSGDTIRQTLSNSDSVVSGVATYVVSPIAIGPLGCAGPSVTINVTVRALPTINFPSPFYAVCSDQPLSVQVSPSVNPSTVAWTVANSLGKVTGQRDDSVLFAGAPVFLRDTLKNTTNNTSDTVTYTVQAISTLGGLRCPGSSKTIRVAVNPLPDLTSATAKSICSKTRVDYTPTASTGTGASFTWTPGASGGTVSGAVANSIPATYLNDSLINARFDVPGTQPYVITAISAQGCTTLAPKTVTITVNPLPQLADVSPKSVCSEGRFVYTPASSVTTASTTFQYDRTSTSLTIPYIPPTFTTGINDSLSSDHVLTTQTVDYKFTLRTSDGCSMTDQHLTVTVNPTPDTPGIAVTPTTKLCQGALGGNFAARRSAFSGEVFDWSASNGGGVTQLADSAARQYALVTFRNPGSSAVLLRSKIGGGNSCWNKGTTRIMQIDGGGASVNPNVVFFSNNLIVQAIGVTHYQWGFDRKSDLDSAILPGATAQNYPTTGPNTQGYDPAANHYWVLVTFNDGCVRKAYFNAPALGTAPVAASGSAAIRVFPNPATESVTVELPLTALKDLHIAVYDLSGRILQSIDAGSSKTVIPVGMLAPGCYMIVCTQGGARIATSRFIRQ